MCGIFGTTKQGIDMDLVKKCLQHRGPDDFGMYQDDKILLTQARLSIIDLSSGGHQPMWNLEKNIGIIYNGEIYNYQELKENLQRESVEFVSASDTEVILLGYQKHGVKFFENLRGMWGFAIYDKLRNKIVLSRDQFGIKPLVYAFEDSNIIFGSEVKSIVPQLNKLSANTENYYLYFNLGFFPGKETSFLEIMKLLPGEVLEYDLETKKVNFSFVNLLNQNNFKKEQQKKDNQSLTEGEAIDVIKLSLEDSVQKHFIADVPVGVLLSGGNDSSLVAAISKKLGKNPICYNIDIEGSVDNEYAVKVAQHLKLQLKSYKVDRETFKNQYKEVLEFLDQPTSDVSFIPTSLVFAKIKGEAKVVLSGEGGDELFGGYLRHYNFNSVKESSHFDYLEILNLNNRLGLDYWNSLWYKINLVFLNNFKSTAGQYLFAMKNISANISSIRILNYLRFFKVNNFYNKAIQGNLFFDMFLYLPDNLMYKGDMSAMHSSIEGRVPFLDKRLFNSLRNIPEKFRLSEGHMGKKILKKVLENYLPIDLIYRKKTGFGIKIADFGNFVLHDLKEAIRYHQDHKEIFDLKNNGLINILTEKNAEIILKKYPRFAFSIITNHKVMSKYLV